MRGDSGAMSNVAASYRLLGRYRHAFDWYSRAAAAGDGSAQLEVGYCLQVGFGVRQDMPRARRAYRSAIGNSDISDYGREEAAYLLATTYLGRGAVHADRQVAARWLRRANVDDDYPQARELLRAIESNQVDRICLCRRWLRPGLARLRCPIHRPTRVRRIA